MNRVLGVAGRLAPVSVATVPIVWAAARAVVDRWYPVGDNAYFTTRAFDVGTRHHPLLGAWSSGSAGAGVDVNNLGPLQLDLLALPVRVLGPGAGTALGVASINVLAALTVVLLGRRVAGERGAWIGAATVVGLAWTMGSELLIEPRQHHALVLPFLATLAAGWATLSGHARALVLVVLWASFVAQTHLTFVVPAMAVVAVSLGGVVLARAMSRQLALLVLGTSIVVWCQPLWQQLRGDPGNLTSLRRAAAASGEPYGWIASMRATAAVVLPLPGWWRPAFRAFDPAGERPSATVAVVGLVALLALLGLVVRAAHQTPARPLAAGAALAAVAIVAAVATGARSPVDGPFGAVSGNFRYLWPVAALTTAVVVAALLAWLGEHVRATVRPELVLAALSLALAAAALPRSYQSPGPEADAPFIPVARSLAAQLGDAGLPGPVALDRGGLFFAEPYSFVVVLALVTSGTDVAFQDPVELARWGTSRAVDGDWEPTGTVAFEAGDRALEASPDTLIARASVLDDHELDELHALRSLQQEGQLTDAEDERRLAELSELHRKGTIAVVFRPRG